MKKLIPSLTAVVTLIIALLPADLMAGQRRRVVVRPTRAVVRHPVRRTAVVVRRGHPVRRVLPGSVVLRPARRAVMVNAPLVFLPRLVWSHRVVALPAADRLVWQDSESINRVEDWVDTNFGIDGEGDALFINIDGQAKLNFAEVTFANGNVQVVDFEERTHGPGTYQLLDFADGRRVMTVRMLAKSESDETRLAVYLSK